MKNLFRIWYLKHCPNHTLYVFLRTKRNEPLIVPIFKSEIKDVKIDTVAVLDNFKSMYHSRITIESVTDPKTITINTTQSFIRYMPSPNLPIEKYNKYLKKFIMSIYSDYYLEEINNTFFDQDKDLATYNSNKDKVNEE